MKRRDWLAGGMALLAGSALGYEGWRVLRPAGEACYACKRPIHEHSKTVAFAAGRSRLFCFAACALSQRQQSGKAVTVTRLTSFLSGEPLVPDRAFVVREATSICVSAIVGSRPG